MPPSFIAFKHPSPFCAFVINYSRLFGFAQSAIIEAVFPVVLGGRHDMLHALDAPLQIFVSPF
jgi:hypothetical protein